MRIVKETKTETVVTVADSTDTEVREVITYQCDDGDDDSKGTKIVTDHHIGIGIGDDINIVVVSKQSKL
jgi:hypothetical protein